MTCEYVVNIAHRNSIFNALKYNCHTYSFIRVVCMRIEEAQC